MNEFIAYFVGYRTQLAERLSRHPNQNEILANCSADRPLDDVIAFLCQKLGIPAGAWSAYTASLTPHSSPGGHPSLYVLDTRLVNFSRRFGTVVVVSNRQAATDLRQHYSIAITEMTEFDLFKRRVESVRQYVNTDNCMVVGLVEGKEVAIVLKNGIVTNFSINRSPLVRPNIVYIVGTLAHNQLSILPKHKTATDTFIGQDLPTVRLLGEHHTLTPTRLLFGVNTEDVYVDTARWDGLTDSNDFTLITRTKVTHCTRHGECLESAPVATARDFLLRREG